MTMETPYGEIVEAWDSLASRGALLGDPRAPEHGGFVPRYAARRDTNHAEIRDGLRKCGFSVHDAGSAGGDLPDLIVGAHGLTFLVEIKGPRGKLSAGQLAFRNEWRGGPVLTVHSLDEALLEIIKRTNTVYGVRHD